MMTSDAGQATSSAASARQGGAETAVPTSAGLPRVATIHATLAIIAAAVLPYLTALGNGFALDDVPIIQQNSLLHPPLDVERIWTSPYWPVSGSVLGLYRPLTSFLFALQWTIANGSPLLFHAFNIVLHCVVSLLVWRLLSTLLRDASSGDVAAVVGGLLFAVHPLHTEAVANIVGQAELTAAIFVLLACSMHAARPAGHRVGGARLAALLICYAFGLVAKEHAIVLPALLVMIDLYQGRATFGLRELKAYARAVGPLLLGMALTAVLFLAARMAVLGSLLGANANPALPYLRGGDRVWNALRAWPEFFRLLLWPIDLSADYSPGVVLPVDGLTPMVAAGGLLLILTLLAAVRVGTGSLLSLAAGWFLIAVLPVSNLLFPIGVLIAERALYLPSVALSLAVAAGVSHLLPTQQGAWRGLAFTAVALLTVLSVRTAVRNPVWDSTPSVQQALIRTHPESYRAQWSAAVTAQRQGDTEGAAFHYALGFRMYDQDPVFVAEVGNFHIGRGALAEALPYLQRARALYPEFPRAQIYSAYVFNRLGEPDSALAALDGIASGTRDMDANVRLIWYERARALDAMRRFDAASAVWHVIARGSERNAWLYHALRARSLARSGRTDIASVAAADALAAAAGDENALNAARVIAAHVASGCYVDESCGDDPLVPWTGS